MNATKKGIPARNLYVRDRIYICRNAPLGKKRADDPGREGAYPIWRIDAITGLPIVISKFTNKLEVVTSWIMANR